MMVRWHELIEFLRCVSKIQLSAADKEFILRFSQREVPWESIAALAEMEGVSGLLYSHLKNLGLLSTLPKSFTQSIESAYHQTKHRTLGIVAEAERLSQGFEQAGIQVIALQGLSLLSIYGDLGLRYLDDVDLMVRESDKNHLKALLREDGYQNPIDVYPDLLHKEGLKIDIHTHVLNLDRIRARSYLFPEDLTPMWERAIPIFDQTDGILILDPYDNFIALAAHVLKHSYSRLIWLVDLRELLLKLAKSNVGWDRIIERSRFWKQEKVVLYALTLMEGIFSMKAPFWVKSALGIQKLNIFERHLLRLKLRGFSSNEFRIGLWLCNIKGIGKKLEFIRETIFPKDEVMVQIFDHNSSHIKAAVCAKRFGKAIAIMGRGLIQALHLSYRSTGNE
jgi:hypothetical protein